MTDTTPTSLPPVSKDAQRILTLLYNFPGLRSVDIADTLGLSVFMAADTLALLLRSRLVRYATDRYLTGWGVTDLWDPDPMLTIHDTVPDWPQEHGPLAYPADNRLI